MTETTENIVVARNDAEGRYDITVDGELAGFTLFIDRGEQRIFPHTQLDEKFSGRGLSGILVHDALEDTRAAGKRVVPVCPLVKKYVTKHPEVQDIVDPVTPDILDALR
ncbi:N-acetyltransferase [Tsukamurella pulmonis]|uniref:GNAT family N-acetyltransferase n=1 Tax=Tsukamurella pulmonis TaxID=47312 RepID=UPI001EDCBBAA|nr:GNAT family N-acetyltransferase [Tsukamurella pulmonis]BDD84183.1 N-acetyltransferase [Tsukamurella pulmonis]